MNMHDRTIAHLDAQIASATTEARSDLDDLMARVEEARADLASGDPSTLAHVLRIGRTSAMATRQLAALAVAIASRDGLNMHEDAR